MRIEELQNNLYIKGVDTVERYLLNIVQEYFRDSNTALEGSKEYIIKEAVDRLKSEMDYNSLGVLSITVPDGRVLKGDVSLTLGDLGGEPLISPKLSAFNVPFGTKANTACEGNDPRLYDARKPIQHSHDIQDIRGLDGILSTIVGKIERLDTFDHTHDNKNVLDMLVYSGKKDVIDLNFIDTIIPEMENLNTQILNNIQQYTTSTNESITQINQDLQEIKQLLDGIEDYVISKCNEYLTELKGYMDEAVNTAKNDLTDYIDNNYVRKNQIQALIDIAKNCYTLVNEEQWNLRDLLFSSDTTTRIATLPLTQATANELSARAIDIANSTEIIFEFYLEYVSDNKTYRQPLPYADNFNDAFTPFLTPLYQRLTISGYIDNIRTANNTFKIVFKNNENQLPEDILANGKIICDIYSKPLCPVY